MAAVYSYAAMDIRASVYPTNWEKYVLFPDKVAAERIKVKEVFMTKYIKKNIIGKTMEDRFCNPNLLIRIIAAQKTYAVRSGVK